MFWQDHWQTTLHVHYVSEVHCHSCVLVSIFITLPSIYLYMTCIYVPVFFLI